MGMSGDEWDVQAILRGELPQEWTTYIRDENPSDRDGQHALAMATMMELLQKSQSALVESQLLQAKSLADHAAKQAVLDIEARETLKTMQAMEEKMAVLEAHAQAGYTIAAQPMSSPGWVERYLSWWRDHPVQALVIHGVAFYGIWKWMESRRVSRLEEGLAAVAMETTARMKMIQGANDLRAEVARGHDEIKALLGRGPTEPHQVEIVNRTELELSPETVSSSLDVLLSAMSASGKFVGPQGPPGPRGIRGRQGARGKAGAKGERGEKGSRGLRGVQGVAGRAGAAGRDGRAGKAGAAGRDGRDGRDGTVSASCTSDMDSWMRNIGVR